MSPRLLAASVVFAVTAHAATSSAAVHRGQQAFHGPKSRLVLNVSIPKPAPEAAPREDSPSDDPYGLDGYWSRTRPRAFVSSRIDAGTPYVKPQIAVGYGKPHDTFVAVEAFGITTNVFGAGFVGVRFELPYLWVSLGSRYTQSYVRNFVAPQQSYTERDVMESAGDKSKYWAIDADVGGFLPAPKGAFMWNALATRVTSPSNVSVFEESARAVVTGPWVFTGRLAYVAFLTDAFKAGVMGELLEIPGRNARIARLGPIATYKISDHFDAILAATFVVSGPDQLGPTLGAWGIAGVRWKWASGEANPRFP